MIVQVRLGQPVSGRVGHFVRCAYAPLPLTEKGIAMAENAVATVKGGFFEQYGPTVSQVSGVGSKRREAAQALATKGLRDLRERMTTLDGVIAGSAAVATNSVVSANVELGGQRAIETETLINRNTVAGDVTIIEADINSLSSKTTFGANPPANLDGNPLGTR